MKILLIEDDEFRTLLFAQWLRGYKVTVARTAAQAIRQLRRHRFDAVFLDHDLGGRVFVDSADENTGAEVARFLARNKILVTTIVHSHNPIGAAYLQTLLPHARVVPFGADLGAKLPELLADAGSGE